MDNDRLKLVGTPHGDGTVTWVSGRIDGIGQYYYLPASHGDLLATRSSFEALVELVSGSTAGLERTPPQVRDIVSPKPVTYDADPPQGAPTETAALALLGAAPQRRDAPAGRRLLEVRVIAQDLRFIDQPIMVGHHEQDPIVYAERIIDTELLNGDLSQRERLGLYAGPVGTATVVLRAPNTLERLRGSLLGAVVTGLGPLDGSLDQARLTEAARTGALRFLLHVNDSLADVLAREPALKELKLATLLLGFNSSANLSVASSIEALVHGVMEANSRFGQTTGLDLRIARPAACSSCS